MRIFTYLLGGLLLGVILALVVTAFAQGTIRLCKFVDGNNVYTNKAEESCPAVVLPELTIAPTRDYLMVTPTPVVPHKEAKVDVVNAQMCALYEEWMNLTSRTLGGFAHNTVADTQRRLVLVQLFGGGFTPTSCR